MKILISVFQVRRDRRNSYFFPQLWIWKSGKIVFWCKAILSFIHYNLGIICQADMLEPSCFWVL
jgi:hypothetical protein